MLARVLEPEVMDTVQEAVDYDSMDHAEVNRVFVDDLLSTLGENGTENNTQLVLDVGTGTAQIPIELAGRSANFLIRGIDLAIEMIKLGTRNVAEAGLDRQVHLEIQDAKRLTYNDDSFAIVMSNSIVHHIPQPASTLSEMHRVLESGGVMFVRDLARPADESELDHLVETYAGEDSERQRKLFRDSLHAALTVDEGRELAENIGLRDCEVSMTSDRHWTLIARKN